MNTQTVMDLNTNERQRIYAALHALSEAKPAELSSRINAIYSPNALWRGSHPLNDLSGVDAIVESAWLPLLTAFPDLERRDLIFVSGNYESRTYVATVGHFCGTFQKDWLKIPATGKPLSIRYGEVHQIEDGKIVKSHCLWDILDVMRQAGVWPIRPSTGTEGRWAGPLTGDGLRFSESDKQLSQDSLAQTLAMQRALGDNNGPEHFTRDGLIHMDQKNYWHPKMMWFGPSGIGTTRGLEGFVDDHQLPFRLAFPNRKGGPNLDSLTELKEQLGAGHYIRIGDGNYSVTGGWPSVVSPHDGPFLGIEPTGKMLQMRVMDFYNHHEGLIRENWVPIDIIHLLLQMGVDVFDEI